MKTNITLGILGIALVGFMVWVYTLPKVSVSELIASDGIHWHPHLAIVEKGKSVSIPANIGIGAVHNPVHTHDDTGTIHLEFGGRVRKEDIMLVRFFEVWGKKFEGVPVVKINNATSTDGMNLLMHDGDKIEVDFK